MSGAERLRLSSAVAATAGIVLFGGAPAAAATLTPGPDGIVSASLRGAITVRLGSQLRRVTPPARARVIAIGDHGRVRVLVNERPLLAGRGRVRLTGARLREPLRTRLSDPLGRLAQRVALLHELRTGRHSYLGQGPDGRLRWGGRDQWTAGFVAGAEWRLAAALGSARLTAFALADTLSLRGAETADNHDRGFVFGRSAATGYRLGCLEHAVDVAAADCERLRRMAVKAAGQLVALSRLTPAGVIVTASRHCRECRPGEQRVIVDSLPNLDLLRFATQVTGDPAYERLAAHHARWVVDALQQPDGSFRQQAYVDVATGAVTRTGNFQGMTESSPWARGQAWAIAGLARLADLAPELAQARLRVDAFWAARLPAGGLPRYDFAAPAGAPLDSGAAAIATAGLLGPANPDPAALDAARRSAHALARLVSSGRQIGRLGDQAYTVPGHADWADRAELAWGLDYAAEALAAARARFGAP